MEQKYRRFYVDWFNIRKSTVRGAIALAVFLVLMGISGYVVWKNNWLVAPNPGQEGPRDSARILTYEGDVRIIRVTTRKTERAQNGMTVQAGDTIQTQSDGRAQILMIDGSTLSVRPNSTVVIRDSSSLFGGTSVRVKLDDGQIRVRTEDQPENTNNVVEVKETQNRILAQTEASFDLDRQSDRGEIRISRGSVQTNASGVTTTLSGDEYAAVNNGRIASREKLLRPPELLDPPQSVQIPSDGGSRNMMFSWSRPTGGSDMSYQLQIALSPFFVSNKMVHDRGDLNATRIDLSGFRPETYYWRVRVASGSGQKSEWSEPSRFTLFVQRRAARIEASAWKVDSIGGSIYRISGKTDPGVRVRIQGRETFAKSDGSFLLQVSSSSATVGVSLSDDKGNRGNYTLSLRTGRAS